jgi:hypothetical protein
MPYILFELHYSRLDVCFVEGVLPSRGRLVLPELSAATQLEIRKF